jgi:hypothetical protein
MLPTAGLPSTHAPTNLRMAASSSLPNMLFAFLLPPPAAGSRTVRPAKEPPQHASMTLDLTLLPRAQSHIAVVVRRTQHLLPT